MVKLVRGIGPLRACLPAMLLLAGLAGCGGGGGDPVATNSAVIPQVSGSIIKEANAASTASLGYSVASAIYSSGSVTAVSLKSVGPGDTGLSRSAMSRGAARLALDALLRQPGSGRVAVTTKAVLSATEFCPSGGSLSVALNDADNSGGISNGDSGSFSFTNCNDNGAVINGAISFSGLTVTGSFASVSQSVGAVFEFSNLRAVSGSDSVSVNGDMSIQAAIRNVAPFLVELTISGNRMSVTAGADTATLNAYRARVAENESTGVYSYSVDGRISGTVLANAITLSTPVAMSGVAGSFPATGRIQVTADDRSSARVTATSATSITLEIDANGDAGFETSQSMTWAQFIAY